MQPLHRLIRLAQAAAARLARSQPAAKAVAGVVALALGFWGWSLQHPATGWDGILNNVFRTLQLITLQFPTTYQGTLPWQLQVARLAVPVVALLATLHVLIGAVTRPVRLALLPHARDHVLVCGAEALTLGALTALAARGRRIVVLGTAIDPARRETLEGLGLTVAEGDPRQPATFGALNLRHAAAVFLTGEDEVANLNLAVLAMEAARGRPATLPPLHLAVLVDREDLARELDAALDGMSRDAGLHYHRLCPDQEGLRLELARFAPVFRKDDLDRRSHVLVVGLRGQWQPVLGALVLAAQDHPEAPALLTVVVDAAEADALAEWQAARPQLPLVAEIVVLPRGASLLPEAAIAALPPPDLAVVMREDAEALASALALRRPWLGGEAPVLVRQSREDVLLSRLADATQEARLRDLVPFGGLVRAESIARVLDREGDALAMALHASYQEGMRDLPPGAPEYAAAWDKLPENAREANRAAADHAPILFAAAGLRVGAGEALALDDAAVERLARIEHRRWMAERILRGWRHAPARDNARQLHPSLVAYDDLPEAEREKDRRQVRGLAKLLAR
jgi:hypothetical protein